MDYFYNGMFMKYGGTVLNWLPLSPFFYVDLSLVYPYFKYLNWIVPFGFIVDSFLAFVGVYATYTSIRHLLSWFHIID